MPENTRPRLEICVETLAGALEAQAAGADRIELCSGLVEGGVTPSAGLIRATVRALSIPVMVMIRPRPGDFLYTDAEIELMLQDVDLVHEIGAQGVVIGCLTEAGDLDGEQNRRLLARAGPLDVTFHRAFDLTRDPREALTWLIDAGVGRVLTSGQKPSAWVGRSLIRTLVENAAERITIMAGGGVRPHNVRELIHETGALEVHASAGLVRPSPMRSRPDTPGLGSGRPLHDDERRETDTDLIRAMRSRLR